jgi:transposase
MGTMNLMDLIRICDTEESAYRFFFERKRELSGIFCPSCHHNEFYEMSLKRLRCSRCRRDYHPFHGTSLTTMRIPYRSWLILIKLFELEISARKAGRQTGVSYPTALNAFDTIRRSIVEHISHQDELLKGEIEADESYFGGKRKGRRGRGARNKTIVFGILERDGKVSVSIITDASAESLMQETVKKVRRGSLVYTDKWRGYNSLMFCGYRHLNIDHRYKFTDGKVYINGVEGFWSFAKERLIKHHGISKEKFLLYIKEMEWRYNHRDQEVFDLLVQILLGADN